MENNSEESVHPLEDDEAENLFRTQEQQISDYVENNRFSTNTELFSILALLNAYVPKSYLSKEQCQMILGTPYPVKERMAPFINLLNPISEKVTLIHPMIAKRSVELLVRLNFSRSALANTCMESLSVGEPQPNVNQFIKDLLIKREMGEKGKEKFSRLILDILKEESFDSAAQLLQNASDKFRQMHIFPQTVARLYYVEKKPPDFREAENWAMIAIRRAPNSSYVADVLGQVYKNQLRNARERTDIVEKAQRAFDAFKDVERKAEDEEGPEMTDIAGTANTTSIFNNRGLFGFIQVANLVADKVKYHVTATRFPQLKKEVDETFNFFEWYLCYSKPDMRTTEPDYFWKDLVRCYEWYTERIAADSTSFPGLLESLNQGLITSKGRRAGFEEFEKRKATLQAVRDELKAAYEENTDDVEKAERYILSNFILNNKMPSSPQHALVRELQGIINSFPQTQSPEFYLLALLLFWPEEQLQVQQTDDEEQSQRDSENDELQDTTWEKGDEDTEGESAELSPEPMFDSDLQNIVTLMEGAFENNGYAKYLRGRYLLPLFFLGKDSGLSKWIHKSQLDAIVERKVDAELPNTRGENKKKKKQINDLWLSGNVWHVPEIKNILLPVQAEPSNKDKEMLVCAGGKKIKARVEGKTDGPPLSPMCFYLAVNIRGPVVFKVGAPQEGSDTMRAK